MRLRFLLALLTVSLALAACNSDLAAMDKVASRELKGCPERPGDATHFAVHGLYRDRGQELDYDRLVPPDDPRKGFPPFTLVETPDRGRIPIKDVRVGDLVLAMGEKDRRVRPRKVVARWHKARVDRFVEIKVVREDNMIENFWVTPEHPIWVAGKGWLRATQIEEKDRLITRDGRAVWVLDNFHGTELSEEVYTLQVEGDATFFIGHLGIWVHNKPMANPGPGTWQSHGSPSSSRAGSATKDSGPSQSSTPPCDERRQLLYRRVLVRSARNAAAMCRAREGLLAAAGSLS